MRSILILGSKGMLGQELVKIFSSPTVRLDEGDGGTPTEGVGGLAQEEYSVTAWDREDVDVTDEKTVREEIINLWPDVIINATAYNAVDLCETSSKERAKAEMLNTKVPGLLADIANDLQSTIVHYSTDYVFDGLRPKYRDQGRRAPGCCGSGCDGCSYLDKTGVFDGYREYDLPNPLSVYGKTKFEGEKEVEKRCQNHYIIRLSKLFGKPALAEGAKRSFFDVIIEKAKADGAVKVVDGEKSCFTYAPDLARKTRELIETAQPGIYHAVNTGAVTWYEATKKLFEIAGVDAEVEPVAPDEFPRPAKRPYFSVLISTKTNSMRPWEEAVREYLGE